MGYQNVPGHNDRRRTARVIHHISAVTFAVRDMARSVEFYQKLSVRERQWPANSC